MSPIQGRSDITTVLAQMRAMRSAAQGQVGAPIKPVTTDKPEAARSDFKAMFESALTSVNDVQKSSSALSSAFVRGEEGDLVKVMIAGQKASVAFEALTQVRNRMVAAYQEIMNMPV